MKLRYALIPAIAVCAGAMALAQSPFDGTWTLNTEKSHLAGDTMRFSPAGNGLLRLTDSEQTYTFKTDGTPFQTQTGVDGTVTKVDDETYTVTHKRNGVDLSTQTWKLSDGGKTLTIDVKGTRANGDTFEEHLVYARKFGAGKGLVGAWKSTDVNLTAPAALTIASQGKSDVTLSLSAENASCAAKWDGKDYPITGPTMPANVTLAVTRTGPHSFKLVEKLKGKAINIEHFTLSADGKVLTSHGTNGQGTEPYTEVHDKQS
jgi:hypothetical protein